MFTTPDVSVFKEYFVRDFNYAPEKDSNNLDYITDADISKAYVQATMSFNDSLFGDEDQALVAFLYVSAYYLLIDIQASTQGLTSQANFPVNSKSVGGVSISLSIPDRFAKDPFLSMFTQNGYGMKYLSILLPRIVGNVVTVEGATQP